MELTNHKCERCGHSWWSKLQYQPKQCPKCKAVNWWRQARERDPAPTMEQRFPGQQPAYPIRQLGVGEQLFIPWHPPLEGGLPDVARNRKIGRAVDHEEKKRGKKFDRKPTPAGLLLIRLA